MHVPFNPEAASGLETLHLKQHAVRDLIQALQAKVLTCAATFVQTWSNLGDTLVSHAERSFDSGDLAASQQLYNGARQAYDRACSLSSSDQGDDLPGLLHNWGVGLHSHGTHTQARTWPPGNCS